MNDRETELDSIFFEDSTAADFRHISLASLSMLTRINNPLRFVFLGDLDAKLVLSEDIQYLLEFIWLHAAPLDKVRALVSNGNKADIDSAVWDFAENMTIQQMQDYAAKLMQESELVKLTAAAPITTKTTKGERGNGLARQ